MRADGWGQSFTALCGGALALNLLLVVGLLALLAINGLGFFWQLWDAEQLTWHDRLSGTCLRHYPKT